MAAVERQRFESRRAELTIAHRDYSRARFCESAQISHTSDRQMPRPAPAIAFESAFASKRLDSRRQRAKFDAMHPHPNCARALQVRKCADSFRGQFERIDRDCEIVQRTAQMLEPMRIHRRSQKFQCDVQIFATHPSDTVARAL